MPEEKTAAPGGEPISNEAEEQPSTNEAKEEKQESTEKAPFSNYWVGFCPNMSE